jgi:exosortase/archaeosortase family protein
MGTLTSEKRRLALCLAALGALTFLGYRESVLGPPLAGLCALTARAVLVALQMLGVPATLDGTILSHPGGFTCEIYYRCTGFLPVVCLTVAIWASRGRGLRKLAGIALGVPLLLALNLLRVVHVFLVGVTRPDLFELVHGVVWEAAIVAAVIGFWWLWLRVPRSRRSPRPGGRWPRIEPSFATDGLGVRHADCERRCRSDLSLSETDPVGSEASATGLR